jgi:hypothetical protein
MKEIDPLYSENYEETYGIPDYNGKRILEIGADYGSTASYFFKRGAREIISVEGNKVYYLELLKNRQFDKNLLPIHLQITNAFELEFLIELYYVIDLMHLDCEGCEKYLLDVPDDVLKTVEIYQIEIHTKELHEKFLIKFKEMGYKLIRDYWYSVCPCWITVWQKI